MLLKYLNLCYFIYIYIYTYIPSETTALVRWGACVCLQPILYYILNPEEL